MKSLLAQTTVRISGSADAWHVSPRSSSEEGIECLLDLEIQGTEGSGFHLVMSPRGFFVADTWHETQRDALESALESFGVRPDDWSAVSSPITRDEVMDLVRRRAAAVEDPDLRASALECLVGPELHHRTSAYDSGEFACWSVARRGALDTVVIYSRDWPRDPCCALSASDCDMGMDSQWFATLDDAFIAALWDGPLPAGYEVT